MKAKRLSQFILALTFIWSVALWPSRTTPDATEAAATDHAPNLLFPPSVGDGMWRHYTNGNHVNALAAEGDWIWAGTSGGVVRWNRTNGSYIKYTAEDGLVDNWVTAVAIDSEGNKWFGTLNGVSRYDGRTWVNYTTADGLVDSSVNTIATDGEGVKWFGTDHGVSAFDGRTWTTFEEGDGLVADRVSAIAVDEKGHKWFGTGSGISEYDGQKWRTYADCGGVQAIGIDTAGFKWFGGGSEVCQFDGATWTEHELYDNVWTTVRAILIEKRGRIWLSTTDGVIIIEGDGRRWFGASDEWVQFDAGTRFSHPRETGLTSDDALCGVMDDDGHLWFGTSHGLNRFDGRAWSAYMTRDSAADNGVVNAIAADSQGQIWFGTKWGLARYDGDIWTTYTEEDGLADDWVTTIAVEEPNHVWIGTADGVSDFDGNRWITYRPPYGPAGTEVLGVAIDQNGDKWFLSSQPFLISFIGRWVDRFDGRNWITVSETSPGYVVSAMIMDSAGDLWVGTYGDGALRLDGHTWTTYIAPDGAQRFVFCIVEDLAGALWFGTRDGVRRFDGSVWTTYNMGDGLVSDYVRAAALDQSGRLWFGTDQGVSVFDGHTWSTHHIEGGLMDDAINCLAVDSRGHIWFGTENGVSEYMPSSSVAGRVTTPPDQPLSKVVVWAGFPANTTTDQDGVYTIMGLKAGGQTMWPRMDGYTFFPLTRTVTVPPDAAGQDFVGMPGIDIRPYPDGYRFANYGGVNLQDFTLSDMRRMFGDQAVCIMQENACSAYKLTAMDWNLRVNREMGGGHCDGMAVTSLRYFSGADSHLGFVIPYALDQDDAVVATHWSGETYSTTARRNIAYSFVLQCTDPVKAYRRQSLRQSPVHILEQLRAAMLTGDDDPMALTITEVGVGAHTITPIAIEDQGEGESRIWVYDNRYPYPDNSDRYVVVDTQKDTWSYDMGPKGDLGVWHGDAGSHTLAVVPVSVYTQRPTCPFCDDADALSVHLASDITLAGRAHLLISNSHGQRIGYEQGRFTNDIPGAYESFVVDGSGIEQEPLYTLPLDDSYSIDLDGYALAQAATVGVSQYGPGFAVSVEEVPLKPGAVDTLTITPDGFGLTYRAGDDKTVTLVLIHDDETQSHRFTLPGVPLRADQPASLRYDPASGRLAFTNSTANVGGYDIEIVRVSVGGEQTAQYSDIRTIGGQTQVFDIRNWDGVGAITLTVENEGEGAEGSEAPQSPAAPGQLVEGENRDQAASILGPGGLPWLFWLMVGLLGAGLVMVIVAGISCVRSRR